MSASRKMRILSSVVYRLPFILGPFFWPQTNISSGSKKRSHITNLTNNLSVGHIQAVTDPDSASVSQRFHHAVMFP